MNDETALTREQLRRRIIKSLKEQGFRFDHGLFDAPENNTKEEMRQRHALAVKHRIENAQRILARHESRLLRRIAGGADLAPASIRPTLVEVQPNSEDELLFRYAGLHWSIPVSSGYGRRLRFLVIDQNNEKLIGIIGLGDPVFGLAARDNWIGWDQEARKARLRHVMEAFVLGAVPPYSMLLCGKLVALLVASNEVRLAFRRKYGGQFSLIHEKPFDGRLALITTTSALGRSSIYNRLRFKGQPLYNSVGFTSGWGEVFFTNGVYSCLSAYAKENLTPTAKQKKWGTGFRNRREVVRKCLQDLGFPEDILNHKINREVFAIPLAQNTKEFLKGQHSRLQWLDQSTGELAAWFSERWLLPRAARDDSYKSWRPEQWRLWPGET